MFYSAKKFLPENPLQNELFQGRKSISREHSYDKPAMGHIPSHKAADGSHSIAQSRSFEIMKMAFEMRNSQLSTEF